MMNVNTQPNNENPADGRSDSNGELGSAFFAFLNEPQPNDVSVPEWNKMRLQVAFIAGAKAERERIAAWLEPQRNDIPATGKEFANALRAT